VYGLLLRVVLLQMDDVVARLLAVRTEIEND
jgi:hypothetical protein